MRRLLVFLLLCGAQVRGLFFGDYFQLARPQESFPLQRGFWFRRIYFTVDHELSSNLSARFRLEARSRGDFRGTDLREPFVKDMYLQWRTSGLRLRFGRSPTPTWAVVERWWGHRFLERTPLDLFRFGRSRDTGLFLEGRLSSFLRLSLMAGNGEGTAVEETSALKWMAALTWRRRDAVVEVYADRAGNEETVQVFLGLRSSRRTAGLLLVGARRPEGRFRVLSAFLIQRLPSRQRLVLRWDRVSRALPWAPKISYIPVSPDAPPDFGLVAWVLPVGEEVWLAPNLEWIRYRGPAPSSTLLRVTLYARYK